jgi:hypothetical protein
VGGGKAGAGVVTGDTLLSEAQQWLRDRVKKGADCPCCTRFTKVYNRKINSGMARALIEIYRAARTDWVHKPTVLSGIGAAARDESLLRYWGLMEEETERRDDGGRAGWWRITDAGEQWVLGRTTVPKYARTYGSRCLGIEGDPQSIRDALGSKFNYDELMAGI